MNKIEVYKQEKNGLDVKQDLPRYAQEGWEAITDGDRERLKWLGVFFRRQTPGHFMMRVRIPNGMSNSAQFRAIADISQDSGKAFVDLTTRQQIQLRWFRIDQVDAIWNRLEEVGLVSLQTGMDNIRNVVGCPLSRLNPNELFDASPVAREYNDIFVGNKDYTNLPRKFNVVITGCLDNCSHAVTQDIALTPAIKDLAGEEVRGFNVAVGGKQGSGGFRPASDLDIFVGPDEAARLCSHITLIFRDHGHREARNKSRLAFLVDDWGVEKFRDELERRAGHPLSPAGQGAANAERTDHIGITPQIQPGLNSVGMVVPVGRMTSAQLLEVSRLADTYGNGEIRLTIDQNLIIPNVSDALLLPLRRSRCCRSFGAIPRRLCAAWLAAPAWTTATSPWWIPKPWPWRPAVTWKRNWAAERRRLRSTGPGAPTLAAITPPPTLACWARKPGWTAKSSRQWTCSWAAVWLRLPGCRPKRWKTCLATNWHRYLKS